MARPFGRRRISWFGILYPAIGIVVAATHGYLVDWNIPGNAVEGLATIVRWRRVSVFGVDLHGLILPLPGLQPGESVDSRTCRSSRWSGAAGG